VSGHENVVVDMASGAVVLDVMDGEIRFVEVLHRGDRSVAGVQRPAAAAAA
jgi:hypothetical protein